MAARRRRSRNRYLENLGGLPRSTMLTFGLALLLLVASIGIVGATLVRRGDAKQADTSPTAEPTSFVALVETPVPTPETPTAITPTTRVTPATTARTTTPARTTPTVANAGPIGSGQGRAARGIGGSMAIALGGALPPAQAAVASAVPTATRPASGQPAGAVNPTAPPQYTPTSVPPVYSPPPASNPAPGGGGGGGGSNPPAPATPTPIPPTPTTAPPTATPTPTQVPLPAAVLPGPGAGTYSYDLDFTQGANLATVPASNFAYIITWRTYTIEDATALKNSLGLSGQVERTGDGFKVVGPGTLLINNTVGTISYTAASGASATGVGSLALPTVTILTPAPASPAPSTAPSSSPNSTAVRPSPTPSPSAQPTATPGRKLTDEAAIAAAKGWLTKANILPANADGGQVTRPTPEQVVVTFHPQIPGALIAADPMIKVTLGNDGTVREVYHRWPTNVNPRSAALRNVNTAWAEVAAGGGYLVVDQTVPTNIPNGTVFQGAANVTSVTIGWSTAQVGADGNNYLVPVYVFEGTVTLSNPPAGQPNAVPFRVFISAAAKP